MRDHSLGTCGFSARCLARVLVLALIAVAMAGCEGATMLPYTPNVLRDGSGFQLLAQLPPEQHRVDMPVIARHFVVYSSEKDLAVGLADWLFSSSSRLGTLSKKDVPEAGQALLAQIPNVQLVQCFVSGFGTSHDYMFTNPGPLSDLILVLRDRRDPGQANGRSLTPLGGAFWKLDNGYALPATRPAAP